MKRLILVIVAVLAFSQSSLFAADPGKGEVFGGYSFLNGGSGSRTTLNGWAASYTHNVDSMVGITADFGGHYKTISGTKVNLFEYMFGPQVALRQDKTKIFARALFGGTRAGGGGSSTNGFSMGYGGGLDYSANDKVEIRVVQFDWVPVRFNGSWDNTNIRMAFGVVFHAGE
ncbi:MAG TPA: hypothetical protein VFY29_06175 [Terriglobia bacterium]|nr:hypothetical protein [Terriglobia bacterium]